jgi:prepilin-type N-terminal cleavage/methylation domain-containing protein
MPGFTLVEVMIVVAIVGILAAIAIPMFTSHMKKAKVTEAQLQLNLLAKNAKSYYQAVSRFPQGTAEPLPGPDGGACSAPKGRFPVTQDWAGDTVWLELDFHVDDPSLFTYHYSASSTSAAIATAVGDLDCDKQLVTYKLELVVPEGTPAAKQLEEPITPD